MVNQCGAYALVLKLVLGAEGQESENNYLNAFFRSRGVLAAQQKVEVAKNRKRLDLETQLAQHDVYYVAAHGVAQWQRSKDVVQSGGGENDDMPAWLVE